jgi:crossover junction endodeoxyribonuclease RusA
VTPTEHKVWLPFPPSTNNLFTQGLVRGKVRRFPSRAYKAWRKEAVIRIIAARLPKFLDPVVVKLELTPRDNRPRDADNYAKPCLDALVEARVLQDDSNRYVKAVVPFWRDPARQPGVVIFIRPAADVGSQRRLPGLLLATQ